jgi:hypothetical protein
MLEVMHKGKAQVQNVLYSITWEGLIVHNLCKECMMNYNTGFKGTMKIHVESHNKI